MENFMVLANTTEASSGGSMWTILIFYAVIIVGFYLLLIRPSSKKKKKEEAMRKNAQIGDEITTIGGIVGRIISIKEDTDTAVSYTHLEPSIPGDLPLPQGRCLCVCVGKDGG